MATCGSFRISQYIPHSLSMYDLRPSLSIRISNHRGFNVHSLVSQQVSSLASTNLVFNSAVHQQYFLKFTIFFFKGYFLKTSLFRNQIVEKEAHGSAHFDLTASAQDLVWADDSIVASRLFRGKFDLVPTCHLVTSRSHPRSPRSSR